MSGLISLFSTGISILKVDKDGKYERISGSGLGGGTYWGTLSL
jgi:type II pantothenate kinase